MLQVAFVVLVFAALIAVVFGQKAAQSFVRFVVGAALLLLGAVVFVLYRLDKAGKSTTPPTVAVAIQPSVAPTAQAFPIQSPATTVARWVACPACGGTGFTACPVCHGTGKGASGVDLGPNAPPPVDLGCPQCGGTGRQVCATCGGAGGHYE